MDTWLSTPAIALVALVILGIVWKAGARYGAVKQDRSDWKEQTERDRAAFKVQADRDRAAWNEQADRDRAAWNERANRERAEFMVLVREIREDIKRIFSRMPGVPVVGDSPLKLTDLGEQIAESLRAEEWASELAESLVGEISGREPFEIDEFCDEYTKTKLDRQLQRIVAKAAYEFSLDKSGIQSVLRVVLRNELLNRTAQSA